ncbi:beta strand repeat-containing protein [Prosthecobacter sp.]|uniref:beta strand repeat-containing protein n=1 Tax=Prosthecobacter sp. TaxID=1965333 RepID=UPI003785252F
MIPNFIFKRLRKLLVPALIVHSLGVAMAATYTYDTDGTVSGVITEGTTGWNGTNAVWNDGSSLSAWPGGNTDIAIFGGGTAGGGAGTAGTVTVGSVLANGITFNTPNAGSYTLSGGTITLDGTSPTITVNSATAVINSALTGTLGMTKAGAGALTLGGSGANSVTGTTSVNAGTLTLNKTAGIDAIADDLTIAGGSVVWNASNQIANAADVVVSGGLVNFNNFSETFATYTQSAGGYTGTNAGSITVTGAFNITGGNQFTINSGGQLSVGSMSLTGGSGLLVGGNGTVVTNVNIGSGGLTLNGRTIQLNLTTTAGRKGDSLNLQGTLTNTGGSSVIQADSTGATLSGSVTQVDLGADRILDITAGTLTFSNSLTVLGTGTTVKSGTGTLTFNVTAGTNAIKLANFSITGGTVTLSTNEQLQDTMVMTNSGGQMNFNAKTETLASYTQTTTTASPTSLTTGLLTGIGGNVTLTGALKVSGNGYTTSAITISSSSSLSAASVDLTGATGVAVLIGGVGTVSVSQFNIGSGGLIMSGQTINMSRAAAGQFGASINLGGDFTASGTNLISYQTSDGTLVAGSVGTLNLGSTTRTFTLNDPTPTLPPTTGDSSDATTINLVISGSGGITKAGAGNLVFTGVNSNTYTGDTNVNAGRLYLNKTAGSDALAGDLYVNSGGYVQWSQNNQLNDASSDIIIATGGYLDFNSKSETFNNFTKTGGTVQSTGGLITINGTMTVTGGGSNSATLTETGNRYTINSNGVTTANTVTFVGAGTSALLVGGNGATRITRFVVGSGGITLQGNTLTFNRASTAGNQGSEFVLKGTLTSSGTTTITRDTSTIGVTNLNLNGAERIFDVTGGTTTVNLNIVSNNLEDTIATTTTTVTAGGINKTGAGVLVLNENNTYTGKTTVQAGTLRLGTTTIATTPTATTITGAINDSAWVDVASGATFQNSTGSTYSYDGTLSGSGTVSGNFTITDGIGAASGTGTIHAGGSSDPATLGTAGDQNGTLTFANNLTLATGATRLDLTITGSTGNAAGSYGGDLAAWIAALPTTNAGLLTGSAGNHDQISVTGTLTLNAGGVISVTSSGYTPVFGDVFNVLDWGTLINNGFNASVSGGDLILPSLAAGYAWDTSLFLSYGALVVVPEPGRMAFLLLSLGLLAFRRSRRRM